MRSAFASSQFRQMNSYRRDGKCGSGIGSGASVDWEAKPRQAAIARPKVKDFSSCHSLDIILCLAALANSLLALFRLTGEYCGGTLAQRSGFGAPSGTLQKRRQPDKDIQLSRILFE